MKLENMYEEFPEMPDDMRKMVEDEVARQLKMDLVCENIKRENAMEAAVTEIKTDSKNTQRNYSEKISQNRFGRKKFITIIAAAALALGTTAFAGSSVYKLYKEKIGSYGVGINIQVGEKGDTYSQIPKELEKVEIVNNYIPEGMIQPETDPGKMFFEETTTIGIRKQKMERSILKRQIVEMETSLGKVKVKICELHSGKRVYPEYNSVIDLCKIHNKSYQDVYQIIIKECSK